MSPERSTARPVASRTRIPTVLVVDDDPAGRLIMKTVLEKNGFRVSQADDGSSALTQLLGGDECAIVVTDLHMKHMDGDEMITRLRRDPRTASLPVLIVTATMDPAAEVRLREVGAAGCLLKPIDPSDLVARLNAALSRATPATIQDPTNPLHIQEGTCATSS